VLRSGINYSIVMRSMTPERNEALTRDLGPDGPEQWLAQQVPEHISASISSKCPLCGGQTAGTCTVHTQGWWQTPYIATGTTSMTGDRMPEHKAFAQPTFGLSGFVTRQTASSRFSHTVLPQAQLLALLAKCWPLRTAGYKPGVYVARKWVAAKGASKAPAKSVDIIVYSHAVLAENGEDTAGTEWEIITINANPTAENDVPMPPGTLMANHFGASGGTATGMTAEEFEAAMRKSYEYWGDKALAEGC